MGPYELGGKIKWPEGKFFSQCPSTERLPAETEEEVWNLKLPEPDEFKTHGYMPRYFEFGHLSVEDGIPFSPAGVLPMDDSGQYSRRREALPADPKSRLVIEPIFGQMRNRITN